MSTAAKAHEPTMEEILASIRRIISDDEPAQTKAEPLKAPEPIEAEASSSLGQDDIDAMLASFDAPPAPKAEPLEKPKAAAKPAAEERASLRPVIVEAAPEPDSQMDDLDVFELTDEMAAEPEPAPMAFGPRPASAPREALAERLISEPAGEAVNAAFGSLAHTILSQNARTLDDLVKEMLRPMLKAWLDDNLPPLVERLVRHEIERVARGGR
ncbi:cell pole-organizing protein PopZ [Methylopila capsulata]|uniref:Cell pole-organizing protein PopZ n=1 Tax=Methylopila capsulata TaxID=61654 RepID=A0A9W6MTT7_9HYPH|nr:DUF2497 domain-containing protein [Methylopila capsulata]MBM7853204.1 cell pole-organizing protein PopZ [Methylopila capsulata]GLK57582.1 hypothetical protein GCM10008170_36020 [Methylopila capsulata]